MGFHDRFFKQLLRVFFADLLRLVAPELAARLVPGAARFLDKELFADWPGGRRRELDLLAEVPQRTGEGPAEHKMACLRRVAGGRLTDEERFILLNSPERLSKRTRRPAGGPTSPPSSAAACTSDLSGNGSFALTGNQCALCRLRHDELLDAAHILPDREEGAPLIRNGLALCKLHHAAFDAFFLAVRPDYRVVVRGDILLESDGPMLIHGLQELDGRRILLPRKPEHQPDPELLAGRYERFSALTG